MKYMAAPSRRKLLFIAAAVIAVVLAAAVLMQGGGHKGPKGETNEDRLAYIQSLGWEAESVPVDEKEVLLPEEFPEVLLDYNESQLAAGFDLTRYAGKVITMYTYELKNYPAQGEVLCTLYVYRGRIIGGDIHSTAFTGFMRPLHTADSVKNG